MSHSKKHFKNGINPRKITIDKETLQKLYGSHLTMEEIATKLNTTKRVIHLRMQEHHIPRRKTIGPDHGSWKGGRVKKTGYWAIWNPNHPHANNVGYVKEHILIMEKVLGRNITSEEYIHHINCDRLDNRPINLVVCNSHKQHCKAQHSIFKLLKPLLEKGVIQFDKTKMEYILRISGAKNH